VPPPATWAGRRAESQEGQPPPDEAPSQDPSSDVAEAPGAGEVEEELGADELEEELDEEELDEEELAGQLAAHDSDPAPSQGGETVEADTPALADREAAREAALAGLRARTAEHTAKLAAGSPGAAAPEAEAAVPPGAPAPPPAAQPAPQAPPPAQQAPPPGDQAAPAQPSEPEEGASRSPLWPRFVTGSLLIIIAMATATAISILVLFKDLARGLGGLPSVQSQLEVADPGNPQTILILGSDQRPNDPSARSDTTILLRVAADQITVLSIPRDLKVNIPGHGIDKFNAAYSYGGPKLTLKVVKQLTGITDVNHVVNVDFNGFADAVNAIDCVYVDVDRHYYHSNLGLGVAEQYAEIDVEAGYQRMCGYNALQYVRFRHDDNDLVRAARQQEFLREARQELPGEKVLSDRDQLSDILKTYVTSDIDNLTDIVGLVKLFLAARNAPVVQVHFPADLGGPDAAYVTASEKSIRSAVQKFEGEAPPPPAPAPDQQGGPSKPDKGGSDKPGGNQPEPPPPLIDASSLGQQYAAQLAGEQTKSGKPMVDFPIYYPTRLAPDSTISDDSRAFPIDGPGNDVYRGYKFVATLPTDGYTAYYGVSGTSWKDPPILANSSETRTIDGHEYLLSWDGDQLRFVGWKTDRGSYWVDNTLLNVLTPGQMFGIAESMRKYEG
jgi:LCP family protein required for cell wall assembly